MAFCCTKSLNATLVNTEPLSKTISLGMPCVANIDLRAVTMVDLVDVVCSPGHLDLHPLRICIHDNQEHVS